MSRRRTVEVECPECGEKQNITIWTSLNATVDPKAKGELFDGGINAFKCRKCGYEDVYDSELLYHDMEKKFCVQYYPFRWIDSDDFLKNFDKKGEREYGPEYEISNGSGMSKQYEYIMRPHVVFDIDELMRYVIFMDKVYKQEEQTPMRH